MPDRDDVNIDSGEFSVDERVALDVAAARLADEFEGVFGRESIELFLTSSYDQFAGRAKVTTFLPLLAERFARQHLRALAKVEGKQDDGVPIVLFLYVHNAGRSQLGEGVLPEAVLGRELADRDRPVQQLIGRR